MSAAGVSQDALLRAGERLALSELLRCGLGRKEDLHLLHQVRRVRWAV